VKPRQSTVWQDCFYCMGAVTRHWCQHCKEIHEFGHSSKCPRFVTGCPDCDPAHTTYIALRPQENPDG